MSKSWRRTFLVPVFLSLALATLPSVTLASHSWNGYHWARQSNPFNLKIGDNVSSAWDTYLITTINDWSASSVLNMTRVAGQSAKRNCRPTTGRVEVCNDTYGNNGWLGIAQIWISGKHITQGVVKLNDTYFNTARYNTPGWRNLVSCQEVGHTIGLDHQDENFSNTNLGTCMDYTNNPYGPPDNEHPNKHDYDQLNSIYAHLDGSTTVGSAVPPAMNDIELTGPRQWGRLVRQGNGGRTAVYEADFGHGHRIFTFVIWADLDE
jgi:hypothetical protein